MRRKSQGCALPRSSPRRRRHLFRSTALSGPAHRVLGLRRNVARRFPDRSRDHRVTRARLAPNGKTANEGNSRGGSAPLGGHRAGGRTHFCDRTPLNNTLCDMLHVLHAHGGPLSKGAVVNQQQYRIVASEFLRFLYRTTIKNKRVGKTIHPALLRFDTSV